MPTVALLGARGLVGALIADGLAARGIGVIGVGRTPGETDDALVQRAVAGVELVVNAAGATSDLRDALVRVACRSGTHLVDVVPEQAHVLGLHLAESQAIAAGISIVSGAGFQHAIGDALAHLAGAATHAPREVHVAYTLPDRGALLAAASAGRRRSAARELAAPCLAVVRGELVPEQIGEQRRLAWFPRPVGPAHAANIPGGEAITVPRHVPGVQTVRTYVALSGWRSELLQATANLARAEPVRNALVRRVQRPRSRLDEGRRAAIRWGAVAEADGDGGVARAWAYGHDPYRLTATAAVACTEVVLAAPPVPGVRSPAELGPPEDLLDVLATRTDLRWSIARPNEGGQAA